jgi:methionyl aminopeptidase
MVKRDLLTAESVYRIVRKSRREINLMRKAGLLVWQAHQRVGERIAPGVTTAEIDRDIEQLFEQYGATPLFKGYPGEVPFPAVTCMSLNQAIVHGIPNDRPLKEGDVVSVDTGCRLGGWCGDAAATYPVGRISDDAQKLLDVTSGVLQLSIELLAKKSRWSEVAAEMAEYVESAGFSVVEDFVGHGIGREMHEDPQVPNYCDDNFRKNGDFRLKTGLVLAIEPMVNMGVAECREMPDHWTQVTADGQLSAHFEHTVALTSDGPWVLTGPPDASEEI